MVPGKETAARTSLAGEARGQSLMAQASEMRLGDHDVFGWMSIYTRSFHNDSERRALGFRVKYTLN